ncbi:MAG: cysteine desulfurase [Pseudomonadota bacterium]|nr:cysteine desulfurase [Pseudomonadota bacterium]
MASKTRCKMTVPIEQHDLRLAGEAAALMTSGGDARIVLDPATGLNRYFSAPLPSAVLAYASSTANDISPQAFAHVTALLTRVGPDLPPAAYREALEELRHRIRRAYGVREAVRVVFAASGTDLEYVALACAAGRAPGGTHNILLGADEVGSGCIHSAHGRYFAEQTALGHATRVGEPVPGFEGVSVELIDVPVRDPQGRVRPSADISAAMYEAITAEAARRHTIVHVVHGSKTGLILPTLDDLDRLRAEHRSRATFVVDACQARITSEAVQAYLDRGAIVFITGSKFMGGPPFSGFALVPAELAEEAAPLPGGLATIFRRAEWPADWPGADALPEGANPGLLLRLEASILELERFQALPPAQVERVILAFHAAVRAEIIEQTPARRVAPYSPGEMRTLSTLDLSRFGGPSAGSGQAGASFEDAQRWHKALLDHGVRLGQPVKCVRLQDGRWGATLRTGLAMWQIADRAELADDALARAFAADMRQVREALLAVASP